MLAKVVVENRVVVVVELVVLMLVMLMVMVAVIVMWCWNSWNFVSCGGFADNGLIMLVVLGVVLLVVLLIEFLKTVMVLWALVMAVNLVVVLAALQRWWHWCW